MRPHAAGMGAPRATSRPTTSKRTCVSRALAVIARQIAKRAKVLSAASTCTHRTALQKERLALLQFLPHLFLYAHVLTLSAQVLLDILDFSADLSLTSSHACLRAAQSCPHVKIRAALTRTFCSCFLSMLQRGRPPVLEAVFASNRPQNRAPHFRPQTFLCTQMSGGSRWDLGQSGTPPQATAVAPAQAAAAAALPIAQQSQLTQQRLR